MASVARPRALRALPRPAALPRSVLVPALVLDIGPRVWWPSRLAITDGEHRPEELDEEAERPQVAV